MRIRTLIIVGIILAIICILILANSVEQGDTNAIGMYLIVFLIPSSIVVVLNSLYIFLLSKQKSKVMKVIGSMLPVTILTILSYKENFTFSGFDGNLVFVAQVCAIALGVTNLLWIFSIMKAKPITLAKQ